MRGVGCEAHECLKGPLGLSMMCRECAKKGQNDFLWGRISTMSNGERNQDRLDMTHGGVWGDP